ncbi:50S ribosomal protein L9 [Bienertia sinuspersici]
MDPSSLQATSPVEEDEWDTDGFVIPSLGIENPDQTESEPLKDKLEKIYLGPHGAPPQSKQQESNISTSRKQRFKQKLKEADKKTSNTGRENRVESLREIVGTGGKLSGKMAKGQSKDWLDSHCDESMFERLKHR